MSMGRSGARSPVSAGPGKVPPQGLEHPGQEERGAGRAQAYLPGSPPLLRASCLRAHTPSGMLSRSQAAGRGDMSPGRGWEGGRPVMQDSEAHPPPSAPLSLAKSHDSYIRVSPWFPPEPAHLSQAGGEGTPTQATGLFGKRERKPCSEQHFPARQVCSTHHRGIPEPPSWADPRPRFTGSTLGANRDRLRLPHRDPDSWPRKAHAEAAHGPRVTAVLSYCRCRSA